MSLTAIKLTDAANTISSDTGLPCASLQVEYPTASPFSPDGRYILILAVSYFILVDLETKQIVDHLLFVDASSEPRWSRHDPNVFYFHKSNVLYRWHANTGLYEAVHVFTEYASIGAKGESEIGEGSDSLVLAGDGWEIFVFEINSLSKGTADDVLDQWDAVALSPDGNVLLAATEGLALYDRGLNYLRQIADANGHRHFARDTDGTECLIWTNSADRTPIPEAPNAIALIPLADPIRERKLLSLPWTFAVHITAPMGNHGWCIVGSYDGRGGGGLMKVYFDGRPYEHLLDHGSTASTYESQPRPSVSRDGRWLAFNSDKGGRVDVYLVDLGGTDPAPLPPIPGSDPVHVPSSDGLDLAPDPVKVKRRGGFWSRVKGWIFP